MNLYFRLMLTVMRSLLEQRLTTRDTCEQWFRVLPTDIDAFGHMNNGRYLQMMDVARMRWLVRTGTIAAMYRSRWAVALGGNLIRYRRPLVLFARYRVTTRLMCWDDQWFYLEHAFFDIEGRRLALGVSRAAFRAEGKWLGTQRVMDRVDRGVVSPPIPSYLREWLALENASWAAAEKPEVRV